MRAVLIRQFGDPSSLKVEEVPTPRAGDGQAVLKVMAAGISPGDVKNVQGKMHGTTLPRIPGRDFAGVVVEGPRDWIGREVWGTGGDVGFTVDGSHAQYVLIPATALTAKPQKLSMDQAGTAGVAYVTAWAALVTAAKISSSDTALIVGGGGAVGSAAVQIAKSKGARVIGAVQSDDEAQRARDEGVHVVINSKTAKLDTSGVMFPECVEAAAMGGRIAVMTASEDGKTTFNLRSVYRKGLRIIGVDSRPIDVVASAALLAQMSAEFDSGAFKVKLSQPRSLNDAAKAYEEALRGSNRIYLRPND
jgi:NADPH:quinone reductase